MIELLSDVSVQLWFLWIASCWLIWILGNLTLMLLINPDIPCFTGFHVRIPRRFVHLLSNVELAALIAHEHGHRHHWHVWKNFVFVCLFMEPRKRWRREQELQADDYAAERGHAASLASALRTIGIHTAFDNYRARRLDAANDHYISA